MDLINLPATGNFRTKKDFDNYTDNLPAEFITQVPDENGKNVTENNTAEKIGEESCQVKDSNEVESQEQKMIQTAKKMVFKTMFKKKKSPNLILQEKYLISIKV